MLKGERMLRVSRVGRIILKWGLKNCREGAG